MTLNRNDSQFSSKELNKILPSYILEEIGKEHPESESETQDTTQSLNLNNFLNNSKIRFNIMKEKEDEKMNNNWKNISNIINNEKKICKFNNDTIVSNRTINSGNNCNNIFVNIMNKDINKYQFCNYNYNFNNLSNDYNNINYNYNCFNINNINCQINNTNYLFPNNPGNKYNSNHCKDSTNNINILNNFNNVNDININCINIIQNKPNQINTYNPQDKKITLEEFVKFINNISMPIIDFVCNSKGALELQKILEKAGFDVKLYFITILKREGLTVIMKNVHGNYFFQKLIKDSSEKIISNIILYILEDFIDISKDDSGTFSIQALLSEISSVNDLSKILQKIKGHEIEMIYNKNATYVVQKIVLKFPDFLRKDLNEIILQNFSKLCLDVNGICLVKNFIKTNIIENDKERMKIIITNNFVLLAQSPFGNYAIQFLLEKLKSNELNELFEVLNENIFKLSVQQYSSNVVEKAIEKMDEVNRGKTLEKLFFQGKFIILLKNKFGKFVISKAVSYMPQELKNKFEFDLVNNINNGVYNHKDKNRVKKFLAKMQNNSNNNFVNHNNNFNFYMDINCNNKNHF
jgi:hypothetical protein